MPTHPYLIDENCPACCTPNPLEIVHGAASLEMLDAQAAGLIALGRPVVSDDDPAYRCRLGGCGSEWGRIDWAG